MHIKLTDYRASPGSEVDLKKRPTAVRPSYRTNREFRDSLSAHLKELGARQELLFNRSYYEEVLIVRVHPEILQTEGPADELMDEKTIWRDRYRSIVNLERHLIHNGTRIIKLFLHLSQDEQRRRFISRIDTPASLCRASCSTCSLSSG